MPTSKAGRYHHGDLRAALIGAATELIAEAGVRNFSMAAASRRLGVAVSAPYAHFADRDELLAAVAVRAYELFNSELAAQVAELAAPADRLAAVSHAYVRFAGTRRELFEFLNGLAPQLRKTPEVQAAMRPAYALCMQCVRDLGGDDAQALAFSIGAVQHGYAMMLLDGDFDTWPDSVTTAAEQAAGATRALICGRLQLPPVS